MFHNVTVPKKYSHDPSNPGDHGYLPTDIDHTCFILAGLLFQIFEMFTYRKLTKKRKDKADIVHVDENIGEFFESLSGYD
jgi:hypothetical protein